MSFEQTLARYESIQLDNYLQALDEPKECPRCGEETYEAYCEACTASRCLECGQFDAKEPEQEMCAQCAEGVA